MEFARTLIAACAVAIGAATLFVLPEPDLQVAAGLALVAAGALVAVLRPGFGSAAISLAGIAWLGGLLEGWEGGPALVRSLGTVAGPFVLPLVALIALGRGRGVAALFALAAAFAAGLALFRDPLLDLSCSGACGDNVFLLTAQPRLVSTLDRLWAATGIPVGLVLAVSLRRAPVLRWPVVVPGVFVVLPLPLQVRSAAVLGLATGIGWTLVRAWRARRAVARLASDLGDAPGSLALALARATGDPRLEVVYPLPGSARYVDASGRTVRLPGDRVATPIVRDGQVVATVVHDAATVQAEQLRTELGAAARLAIENERLRAEVLAQLEDLRASRLRVVEAGDEERRRLERNLHDGAQQRLLALSLDLRLARASAEEQGDAALVPLLTSAQAHATEAVTELRELAQGIYPAALTDSGLGPALWLLAEEAALPVELEELPDRRFPPALERTVYLVVAEAVGAAAGAFVAVCLRDEGDVLVVEVEGAGAASAHIADRVGALGATLHLDGALLRAEIPCASS